MADAFFGSGEVESQFFFFSVVIHKDFSAGEPLREDFLRFLWGPCRVRNVTVGLSVSADRRVKGERPQSPLHRGQ